MNFVITQGRKLELFPYCVGDETTLSQVYMKICPSGDMVLIIFTLNPALYQACFFLKTTFISRITIWEVQYGGCEVDGHM